MIFIVLLTSVLFLSQHIYAMESLKAKSIVYLQNNDTATISFQAMAWLSNHSLTIKNMQLDVVEGNGELSLPLSLDQFGLLKTKVIDKATQTSPLSFERIGKAPMVKDLIELLQIAHVLEIASLEKTIIREIAQRYHQFPSLAHRHYNVSEKNAKYIPQFKYTKAESAVAKKIVELSVWDTIKCLKVIKDSIHDCYLSPDRKQIVARDKKTIYKWNSTSGELEGSCTFDQQQGYLGLRIVSIKIATHLNRIFFMGFNGAKSNFLFDSQGNLVKTINKSVFFTRLSLNGKIRAFISPDNNKLILSNREVMHLLEYEGIKDGEEKWKNTAIKITPSSPEYRVTFDACHYMTKDGKYLLVPYRYGIKKINLDTHAEGCFDFIPYHDPNQEVSALAVTADESKIVVGICESTCKTKIKILDFDTGTITNTIDINPQAYCDAIEHRPPEGWPYDYISAITTTPDGTKIIVASKKAPTKIIDITRGKVVQEIVIKNDLPAEKDSFLGVNADGTKIIAGYNQLAIYGNPHYEEIASVVSMREPLSQILKILATKKN